MSPPSAGNLCRHSAFFYEHLHKHGFINAVIDRCRDDDESTRKFAVFALGNAAFHSDALYPALIQAVEPMVELLQDLNAKTRINAVGALGNMVRSGEQLVPALVQAGAVQVLFCVLCNKGAACSACCSCEAMPTRLRLRSCWPALACYDRSRTAELASAAVARTLTGRRAWSW